MPVVHVSRDAPTSPLLAALALARYGQRAIKWDGALPALPRPLSGHVLGISGDTLIVAGGTDFPISLFQGGAKVWYDDVYALPPGASAWIRQTVKWPRPIGYAAVVSIERRRDRRGRLGRSAEYRRRVVDAVG